MPVATLGHLGQRTIIFLMGAIAIITLLPITLYLPLLPDIADSLHNSQEDFQFTLPLYAITRVVTVSLFALLAGLGYRTVIYHYEPHNFAGLTGKRVQLDFQEDTHLSTGKSMHYRHSRDVHVQYPPESH